jgi:hypothetical protein
MRASKEAGPECAVGAVAGVARACWPIFYHGKTRLCNLRLHTHGLDDSGTLSVREHAQRFTSGVTHDPAHNVER